jgi:hypothetical protein
MSKGSEGSRAVDACMHVYRTSQFKIISLFITSIQVYTYN